MTTTDISQNERLLKTTNLARQYIMRKKVERKYTQKHYRMIELKKLT
jgi:hypothetical protein